MTPEEFIAEAKRRGYSKEETKAKYDKLISQKAFSNPASEPAAQSVAMPKKQEQDFSLMQTIKNIPGSLYKMGADTIGAIASPGDTYMALENTLYGGMNKVFPGFAPDHEKYADAAGKYYKDRWGGIDNIKKTVMNDPAGALSDVSLFGGLSTLPAKGTKIGRVLNKAAVAIDPLNIGLNTAKAGVKGVTHLHPNLPRNQYKSAAKFVPSLGDAQHNKLADTALKYNIMPTGKGVDKLSALKNGFATKINNIINSTNLSSKGMEINQVFRNINELKKEMGGLKLGGAQNLKKIDNVVNKFKEHAQSLGKTHFTPDELQKFKIDIYNEINWNTAQQRGKRATTEAQKNIARTAKESLEMLDPRIKPDNLELGRLLELEPNLNRSSTRIGNRDMIGIGVPIKIGAGAALDSGAAVAAATMSLCPHRV